MAAFASAEVDFVCLSVVSGRPMHVHGCKAVQCHIVEISARVG